MQTQVKQCRIERMQHDGGSNIRFTLQTTNKLWQFDFYCGKHGRLPHCMHCLGSPKHSVLECRQFWARMAEVEASICGELDSEPAKREKAQNLFVKMLDLFVRDIGATI